MAMSGKKIDGFVKEKMQEVNERKERHKMTHRALFILDDPEKYILQPEDIPLPWHWYKREGIFESANPRPSKRTKATMQ